MKVQAHLNTACRKSSLFFNIGQIQTLAQCSEHKPHNTNATAFIGFLQCVCSYDSSTKNMDIRGSIITTEKRRNKIPENDENSRIIFEICRRVTVCHV